ncbi:MAG: methionine--tRNA ligase [Oscillospiraceae bacterium]|nr:methionine--tRNA ligase [Oscillospiraceae bacterium]
MKVLIGNAWTYANGPLHIGHLSAYLPGDVIARYHRAIGDDVYFVSGSDCHGTPVAIRARQEGVPPQAICDRYHEEYRECFERLAFSYDRYGKTTDGDHKDFVREFHGRMYESRYVYEKEAPQAYCESCGNALADRFVVGKCPECGAFARGDQCEGCGLVMDPENLVDPKCHTCGATPAFQTTRHLFLALTELLGPLTEYIDGHPEWRKNASALSRRYLNEGLRDRALTRSIDWGIDVPKEGYSDKKIYVWFEAVLGYLSMCKAAAAERGADFGEIFGEDSKHYYVHGKDNIPFHTIILPALMLANGGRWRFPDEIVSSEFLTIEGRKISTSANWAVWVADIAKRFHPDTIRYFLIANGPERRDADFQWAEFMHKHNGEILGAYGNLINRTLAFIAKYLGNKVPKPTGAGMPDLMAGKVKAAYGSIGARIAGGELKDALDEAFALVRYGNKFYDEETPWITRNTDPDRCGATINACVQLIANLACLLKPFMPVSSETVLGWLGLDDLWSEKTVAAGYELPEVRPLFAKIERAAIDEEMARLGK